jgi:phosphatidylglycerol:prolipoprotein diacylglycerol transferase
MAMNQEWMDPVIFSLGPLQVRWYGAMYVMGFLIGGAILKYLADKKFWPLPKEAIDKYVTMLIIGMFLGARLFYILFYNWEYYSVNLIDVFAVWKGGLSFHGAVFGMCTATWIFARKNNLHFFQIGDCMAVAGSPGLLCGRLGNFINGELYGRVTDSWAGIVFPGGGPFPRHPSQLYEGFLEGIVLFVILFYIHKRERFYGVVSAFFLLGYGTFRFIVEFFREPDSQLGFYLGYFTMGQILCFCMLPLGLLTLLYAKKLNIKNPLHAR